MGIAATRGKTGAERTGSSRVLAAAYGLFTRRGVRQVGVDDIVSTAAVAKATLYRNFASRDDLVVAFLEERGHVWTDGWLKAETLRRKKDPKQRLLVIFDVLDEWIQRDDFEGCPFIGAVAHAPEPKDRIRREAVAQLRKVHDFVRGLAVDAELAQPSTFASSWQLMMEGAIVTALAGDRRAAVHARRIAKSFLDSYPTRPRRR